MTSRERCAGLALVTTPQVSLGALLEVRAFVSSLSAHEGHHERIRADVSPAEEEARSDAQHRHGRRNWSGERPDEVRWDDLPPEIRERAREWLAQLLRQGAGRARPPQEAADEA